DRLDRSDERRATGAYREFTRWAELDRASRPARGRAAHGPYGRVWADRRSARGARRLRARPGGVQSVAARRAGLVTDTRAGKRADPRVEGTRPVPRHNRPARRLGCRGADR